ncbi:MAG: hypothetical protein QOE64_139 [Frankiales bacterium]|nr:hypothetical protein [Frankiales bacterium]
MRRATRALVYGLAGMASEVVTTGVRSHGRDKNWRLTGTTYLWMLPIYGSAAYLLEPVHDRVCGWPWWRRGALWAGGIYAVEAASGAAIKKVSGEIPWDYGRARGVKPEPRHWRGLVRPSYAPLWFAVGLGAERLHDLLDRAELRPRG